MTCLINYLYNRITTWASSFLPEERDVMFEIPFFKEGEWQARLNIDAGHPNIPPALTEFLEAPCPICPGKTRKETHLVCLVVKGTTLKSLYQAAGGTSRSAFLDEAICNTPVAETYWAAIFKKPIPDTRNQSFETQQQTLTVLGYETPSLVELGIGVQAAKENHVPLFFGEGNLSRTRDKVSDWPVALGMDQTSPFSIELSDWNQPNGLTGVVRFKIA